jgi:hypothetical protein
MQFGIPASVADEVIATIKSRNYSAGERAAILGVAYAERQRLKLRRTGAIDLDREGRERLRRDRYNAKRKAERAEKRRVKVPLDAVASIESPSLLRVVRTVTVKGNSRRIISFRPESPKIDSKKSRARPKPPPFLCNSRLPARWVRPVAEGP